MKILYVISSLVYGGAERQVIAASNVLAAMGHQVTLFVLDDKVPRLSEVNRESVNVVIGRKSTEGALKTLKELNKVISEFLPDVVHSFLFDADILSRLASVFRKNYILVASERNDSYSLSFKQKIAHYPSIGVVDIVIANSYSGATFAERLYCGLKKIEVVWNGIDIDEADRRINGTKIDYGLEFFGSSGVKIAVMIASIKPQKNHHMALLVADRLLTENKDWCVLFIGDKLEISRSDYKNEIETLYNSLKSRKRIKFAGRRNDVIEILAQSKLSFLTSLYEGFPNAVLESMVAGVPVVSTKYSDIEKILPSRHQICSNYSVDEFMRCIYSTIEKSDDISKQQRSWVENNATVTKLGESLERIYLEVVDTK